jgi:hypothetical protein
MELVERPGFEKKMKMKSLKDIKLSLENGLRAQNQKS